MVSEQKLPVELRPLFRLNQFKVVDLVSDPNLYKCIYDPDIRQHVFSHYRVLTFKQLNEYKLTGKVSFVPC